jgi:hypothetical protein
VPSCLEQRLSTKQPAAWKSWGSYAATTVAWCLSTALTPESTVPVMTVSNRTFCHHKPWWTLDDPAALSTQARGGVLPLVVQQKAFNCTNTVPHFALEMLLLVYSGSFICMRYYHDWCRHPLSG